MALIKCPECGKEISDRAKMCIGCGFPLDEYLAESKKESASTEENIENEYASSESKIEKKPVVDETFNIEMPTGDYIRMENSMISVKIGERQATDSLGCFVMLHGETSDYNKTFSYSFINKSKVFFSGISKVTLDDNNLFEAKKFIRLMKERGLFAGRSFEEERNKPIIDVLDIENNWQRTLKGKKPPKGYSTARSKRLMDLLSEYNRTHTFNTEHMSSSSYCTCPKCGKQNLTSKNYCAYCGHKLSDLQIKSDFTYPAKKEFHGIYKYDFWGRKSEVYCPRCFSQNCQYFTTEKFIPGKTKTTYKANINPLKPFTLVNKKEKVISQDRTVTEQQIICNDCGKIFS